MQKSIGQSLRQLSDLNLSQRVAIALGALMVAGSLAWLTQWASSPEMTPLLDQDLSGEEMAAVRSGLEMMGEPYQISGSRVLVSSGANLPSLLAHLQQTEKLPSDMSAGFSAMIRESSPWVSQEENNRRWTVALKSELERVLRQMAGVKSAYVFLNLNGRERGFSREQPAASASVTLALRSGEPVPRSLALAAARLVSGSVRGLPLRNVEVVDSGGRVALEWDQEDESAAPGLARLRAQHEREVENKIARLLDFDPKMRVKVQVVLDHTSRRTEASEPIDGVTVSETTSETVSSRGRPGGTPGVEPNVGLSAGAAQPADDGQRTETREAQFQPGVTTSSQATPAGGVQQVYAAINLSYSYLATVLKRQQPELETPTEEQIQEVFERQKARIQSQVSKLVLPPDVEQVAVDWYYDVMDEPAPQESAPMSEPMALASQYGPAAGLGLLALVSMGLMLRMARRADAGTALAQEIGLPKEAIEAARKAAEDLKMRTPSIAAARQEDAFAAVASEPAAAGAAAAGLLEAREVDPNTVQVQAMIEQVSNTAEADPASVAAMMSAWMSGGR